MVYFWLSTKSLFLGKMPACEEDCLLDEIESCAGKRDILFKECKDEEVDVLFDILDACWRYHIDLARTINGKLPFLSRAYDVICALKEAGVENAVMYGRVLVHHTAGAIRATKGKNSWNEVMEFLRKVAKAFGDEYEIREENLFDENFDVRYCKMSSLENDIDMGIVVEEDKLMFFAILVNAWRYLVDHPHQHWDLIVAQGFFVWMYSIGSGLKYLNEKLWNDMTGFSRKRFRLEEGRLSYPCICSEETQVYSVNTCCDYYRKRQLHIAMDWECD